VFSYIPFTRPTNLFGGSYFFSYICLNLKIIMNWQSFTYRIQRKYQQIKRVIDFLPIIWNGFDFDYMYSIELFKKQLERQAELFESDKLNSDRSKQNASRIRTAINLMDKVYNGDYELEWMDTIREKYGNDVFNWEFVDTGRGDGTSFIKSKYEYWDNVDEIDLLKRELMLKSKQKQKKSEQLLWKFIEHNIRYWWS
jgi:hypothetical protein